MFVLLLNHTCLTHQESMQMFELLLTSIPLAPMYSHTRSPADVCAAPHLKQTAPMYSHNRSPADVCAAPQLSHIHTSPIFQQSVHHPTPSQIISQTHQESLLTTTLIHQQHQPSKGSPITYQISQLTASTNYQ